jgi:hypothetical protein
MLVGNWSVSQPMSVSPVLASTEPSAPGGDGNLHLVTHGVAGERGVVGFEVELEVLQQVVSRRKFRQAAASESYWCVEGSRGFGSM